jgi:hypothetical protein
MKNFPNLLMSITFLSLFLLSCEKNDTLENGVNPVKGKITFNLNQAASDLKSSSPEDFLSLSSAIVSIETANGDSSILKFAELKLFRIGTALFTEALTLPEDDYVLTHFFLQDSTGNTLYVCPQEGSLQAQNVNKPVPIEFTVLPGQTNPVSVEVLSTKNHSPEDFGLSYFEVNFVKTFALWISAVDSKNDSPLAAQVQIDADASYSFLTTIDSSRFNIIQIKDELGHYTFTVSKEGYQPKSVIFPLDSLKKHSESPLVFILERIDHSLQSNIILDYQLNGNAFDDGVNGYHLDGFNVEHGNDRFGNDAMAFTFNGQGGLAQYDKTIINQSDEQTLTAWFNTSSLNQHPEYGGFIAVIIGSEGAGEGSRFSLNIKNGYVRANYGDGFDPSDLMWHDRLVSDVAYNDGEWHFVAFVSTGDYGQLSLYVDGELVGQQAATRSNNNQVDGLDIKIGGDSFASYFTGNIDEVTLYNKALNEAEIKYLFSRK